MLLLSLIHFAFTPITILQRFSLVLYCSFLVPCGYLAESKFLLQVIVSVNCNCFSIAVNVFVKGSFFMNKYRHAYYHFMFPNSSDTCLKGKLCFKSLADIQLTSFILNDVSNLYFALKLCKSLKFNKIDSIKFLIICPFM